MKKKTYIAPKLAVVEFECDANLMEFSYTPPKPPTPPEGGGLDQDEDDEDYNDDW